MKYISYKNSRDLAWKMLIECDIRSLPVKVTAIAQKFGIKIFNDSQIGVLKPNEAGCFSYHKGEPYIVVDETDSTQRKRFTIAHELGHIFLEHDKDYILAEAEAQANVFASRLLEPACVLWAIKRFTAEEIMEVCDVSFAAAQIRAERMNVLNQRQKYLTSPLERQVFENFQEFIGKFNC